MRQAMAIVHELLRRSNGPISLQDNPSGQGLAAVVHLPR
jgi:signal transduction histidine kinase